MSRIKVMVMAQYAKGQKEECYGKCKFERICSKLTKSTGTGFRCFYVPLLYISSFIIIGDIRNGNN